MLKRIAEQRGCRGRVTQTGPLGLFFFSFVGMFLLAKYQESALQFFASGAVLLLAGYLLFEGLILLPQADERTRVYGAALALIGGAAYLGGMCIPLFDNTPTAPRALAIFAALAGISLLMIIGEAAYLSTTRIPRSK